MASRTVSSPGLSKSLCIANGSTWDLEGAKRPSLLALRNPRFTRENSASEKLSSPNTFTIFFGGWKQQQAFSFEMFVSTSFVALWTVYSLAKKRWVKVRPEERKKKLRKHENRAKREMVGFWSGEFGSFRQGLGRKWVRFEKTNHVGVHGT